jgi:ankyrin repeat protein
MSSNDAKKRKAAFDKKCAANKRAAKRLKRRLDEKEKLAYFKECFDAKDFIECNRLLEGNQNRMIDYLNESFISSALEFPDHAQWKWLFHNGVNGSERYRSSGGSWSMLMQAAEDGNLKVCELVLEYFPDTINERSYGQNNFTALMFAARENHLELCVLLVEKGANIHIESTTDSTALDIARDTDAFNVVAYLESLIK